MSVSKSWITNPRGQDDSYKREKKARLQKEEHNHSEAQDVYRVDLNLPIGKEKILKAEGDYDRLMWDESRCDQVAKLADDIAVLRALEDVVEASHVTRSSASQEFEKSSAAHAAERALATSPVKEKQSMAREDSVRSVGDHEAFDVDEEATDRDAAATLPRDAEDVSDAPDAAQPVRLGVLILPSV